MEGVQATYTLKGLSFHPAGLEEPIPLPSHCVASRPLLGEKGFPGTLVTYQEGTQKVRLSLLCSSLFTSDQMAFFMSISD